MTDPYSILLYPLMGEKSTGIREKENKLTFVVNKTSTKNDIKKAIEELYKIEVDSVNVMITLDGKKKAYIKLSEKHSADEVASHFGVI
ncbi:MAG: 50S ribosomal protein L23 [Methanobacteriota archaeon]